MNACLCCLSSNIHSTPGHLHSFVRDRMLGLDYQPSHLVPTEIFRCAHCQFSWTSQRFTLEQEHRYYQDYGQDQYIAHRTSYEPGIADYFIRDYPPQRAQRQRLSREFVQQHVRDPIHSFLDYGGQGWDLYPCFGAHCQYYATDINSLALGPGFLPWPGHRVDLTWISQCMEHVSDPWGLLSAAASSSRGYIYIDVPREPQWSQPLVHEHINSFTAASLRALVQRSGLAVVAQAESHTDLRILARQGLWAVCSFEER